MTPLSRHTPAACVDSWLNRSAARPPDAAASPGLPTSLVTTPVGPVRLHDSGGQRPCVVLVPDGPNVIEHYEALIRRLSPELRVLCFDMPGFGFSRPRPSYDHSLDQGAQAVLGVLDRLGIARATLAFSCANGFYALRAARLAPQRVASLFLSQTPSLPAMQAWVERVIPRPLKLPVAGQLLARLFRHRAARSWYSAALPKGSDAGPFWRTSGRALRAGGCFCLAGVVQGLGRETAASLAGVAQPCTLVWGTQDRSHRATRADSLRDCVPQARLVSFEDCGHFPDLEQPGRYAGLLLDHMKSLP